MLKHVGTQTNKRFLFMQRLNVKALLKNFQVNIQSFKEQMFWLCFIYGFLKTIKY